MIARPAGAPRFDLPETDAFTRPYWDAAAQGRLLIRRCADCGRAHHYPREFCPRCWSENVVWERASGRATLYTWSVVHRNDLPPFGARVPYTAAVVELAEGPRMMTELVGCAGPDLRVGMDLCVAFRALDGGALDGNALDGEALDGDAPGGGAPDSGASPEGAPAIPVFRPASHGHSSSRRHPPPPPPSPPPDARR